MLIAFQGETGAYSEAAGAKFDPTATFLPCPAFEDVFAAVETGRAGCGVLPIENSIGGTIHRNYDLLVRNELKIVGEIELPVRHLLLALPGTRFEDLKQVSRTRRHWRSATASSARSRASRSWRPTTRRAAPR